MLPGPVPSPARGRHCPRGLRPLRDAKRRATAYPRVAGAYGPGVRSAPQPPLE